MAQKFKELSPYRRSNGHYRRVGRVLSVGERPFCIRAALHNEGNLFPAGQPFLPGK